jgi:type VI secretion system secreted protein Hcp
MRYPNRSPPRSRRIRLSRPERSCTLVTVATERWFLKLDGITGESTHVAHKDEIDVESWSWGVANTGSSSGGGGGGSGKASFQDFQFVSRISRASPALFLACASGSHIKEALLSGIRGVGKGTDFLKYKLRDVMVTSLVQGDAEETAPTEQFSLNFSKVEISYAQQASSGKSLPAVTAGWDLKVNKKI